MFEAQGGCVEDDDGRLVDGVFVDVLAESEYQDGVEEGPISLAI